MFTSVLAPLRTWLRAVKTEGGKRHNQNNLAEVELYLLFQQFLQGAFNEMQIFSDLENKGLSSISIE